MKYAIVIFLDVPSSLQSFILKHNDDFLPHITIAYPFECDDENKLIKKIEKSLDGFEKLPIRVSGITTSPDVDMTCVYSKVENYGELERIYNNLKSNIPELTMRTYPFHLTLGKVFQSEIDKFISKCPEIDVVQNSWKVSLIKLDSGKGNVFVDF